MSIVVLKPGLESRLVGPTVSRRACGVAVGGAADSWAAAVANALLRNAATAITVECSLLGPTLRAAVDCIGVLAGAPMHTTLDGQDLPRGVTFRWLKDQVLAIGGCGTGVRAYLAVAGGFTGINRMLSTGDVLTFGQSQATAKPGRSAPEAFVRGHASHRLRVVPGNQAGWFPGRAFYRTAWMVQPQSNRMGVRLIGPALRKQPGEMTSEPVAPGAIQVANDGLPIVLGVDGQTIGGYPKIAHVITADVSKLAQLRPGDALEFQPVTLTEAVAALRRQHRRQQAWLARLHC